MKSLTYIFIASLILSSCNRDKKRFFYTTFTIEDNVCSEAKEGRIGFSLDSFPSINYIDTFIAHNFLTKKRECYGDLKIGFIMEMSQKDYISFWSGRKFNPVNATKEPCCGTWSVSGYSISISNRIELSNDGYYYRTDEKGIRHKMGKAFEQGVNDLNSIEYYGNPILAADLIEDSDYDKRLKRHYADSIKKRK